MAHLRLESCINEVLRKTHQFESINEVVRLFYVRRNCQFGGETEMIGKNKGLHNYIRRGGVLSRLTLNVWMAIAVVLLCVALNTVLGIAFLLMVPLVTVYFILLWRTGAVLGVLICVVTWFPVRVGIVTHNPSLLSFAVPFAIVIYIGAWVYANTIFSRYEKLARQRVSEIEKESSASVDAILEKGILLQAILGRNSDSLEILECALSMQGGDALLWYLGAIALGRMKRYPEELKALNRAISASPDEKLTKQIERLKKSVQRRL